MTGSLPSFPDEIEVGVDIFLEATRRTFGGETVVFKLTTIFAKGQETQPLAPRDPSVLSGPMCSKEVREMFADLLDDKGETSDSADQ